MVDHLIDDFNSTVSKTFNEMKELREENEKLILNNKKLIKKELCGLKY